MGDTRRHDADEFFKSTFDEEFLKETDEEYKNAVIDGLGHVNSQLRVELDRMTDALEHEAYGVFGRRLECLHCGADTILDIEDVEHHEDCPVREAEAIREKYGFDK